MKPWELLGQTRAPDGADLSLTLRSGEYVILANGKSLMSSRMHGSEEALATFACARIRGREAAARARSAGSAWDSRCARRSISCRRTARSSSRSCCRRSSSGIAARSDRWRGIPLKDRRVRVEPGDVAVTLRSSADAFDAILLDVDNGPAAFATSGNAALYNDAGLAAARAALKDGGVLAVWSAREDRKFEQRLRYAGFRVEVERVRARLKKGGPRHTIFLGTIV